MITPTQFYTEQRDLHTAERNALQRKLAASSIFRLLVFVCTVIGGYVFFDSTQIVVAILVLGVVLFLWLLSRHTRLKYKKDLTGQLIAINAKELEVLKRNFHDLPSGLAYADASHQYSQDIDLFGRGSFFQYINRTSLAAGSRRLAHILTENTISHINEKQKAVKELATLSKWRQKFSATAALVDTEVSAKEVKSWLLKYQPFTREFTKILSYGFSGISVLLFVLYFLSILSGNVLVVWFFIGLGISGLYVKKINLIAAQTAKIQNTFLQYHQLLAQIETQEYNASLLSEKRQFIVNSENVASVVLQQFSKHLNALDQRNNIMVALFTNAFMLRDLLQVYHIETWITNHRNDISNWFEAIAFFDAYNSLGNFAFNHPHYTFPEITNSKTTLSAKQAGHPLLDPNACVLNDFHINTDQFFIITGANMAGKSTFLRTVALQIVMANVGLPVCATKVSYTPIKLITSMRTTDSLTDDESYFFSELKRLKYIVDAMKTDRYFIILDEILKGTNSTDKAIGSRKFIDKLVASHSTGIIATHDLSLCKAAEELEEVENYYFDAQIIDNELHFDYTFKKGVCQNMNASFLLKKMGIIN